jgi:hypothetical protein
MSYPFGSCADFALRLREQFGKSSTGGYGKIDFMAAVAAASTLAVSEMLLLRHNDFCHIYNV